MTMPKISSRSQSKRTDYRLNVSKKAFEQGFQSTLKYKKEFGKPNALLSYRDPNGYRLGEWQKTQRKNYKKGVLSPDRVKRLEEIGFKWEMTGVQSNEQWDFWYALTLKYKDRNGTPNAPVRYKTPDGYRLGAWQSRQRESYSKKRLSLDKVKRLEAIGFIWRRQRTNDEVFEEGLQLTLEYKKQFGKPDAPLRYKTSDGYRLGKWQCSQRKKYKKAKLSAERVKKLERIGLKWSLC